MLIKWTKIHKMELTELQCHSGLKEISAAELSIFYIYIHAHRFLKMIKLLAIYVPSINSTPRPYLRVTWRSVPWVTWEAVAGVERNPVQGYYVDDPWLLRLTLANRKVWY
jgi:hypothetical protein